MRANQPGGSATFQPANLPECGVGDAVLCGEQGGGVGVEDDQRGDVGPPVADGRGVGQYLLDLSGGIP